MVEEAAESTRAHAKIIEGEVIRKARDLNTALKTFRGALAVKDLWLTHFDLGVTYVEFGTIHQPCQNSKAVKNAEVKRRRFCSTIIQRSDT
jgi:hypothetical protein